MTIDFSQLEQQYGLPAGLLTAVQRQESGGDANAISPKGAIGTFQFLPATAKQYGIDPTDPEQSAYGAARMYSDLSKKYNGHIPSMLAAYNWGQGNLDKHGLDNAPAETQNYIKSITGKLGGDQGVQYAAADTGTMNDGTEVTDADLLAQLNATDAPGGVEVTDPDLLAQLEEAEPDTGSHNMYERVQDNEKQGVGFFGGLLNEMNPIHRNNPSEPTFAEDTANNFVGGAKALKDLVTFNDEDSPELIAAKENLSKKYKDGTAKRQDYLKVFLAGGANSPGGKALQVAGGVIPEGNIAATTVNKYVNPEIVKNTGLTNEDVQTAELALPFFVKPKLTTESGKIFVPKGTRQSSVPPEDGSGGGGLPLTDALTYPVRHPLKSAGTIISSATKPITALVRPVARSIIEGDNPITGEPGLKTALASDTAAEGARLGKKLGVDFSAGELTGNPTAMGLEDALANSARYGGKFAEANRAKSNAIIANYKKSLDTIHPKSVTRTDVGDRITTAYNSTINNLVKTRRKQAKIDFGTALNKAGDEGKYILSNNLNGTLRELKSEGEARLLTADKAEGAKLANQLLRKLETKTKAGNTQADTITLQEMANGLSDFSNASKRPGGVLEDAKSVAQRRIYARLHDSLLKDLDAELQNPKGNPERAAMLQQARDNYADYSNKIADIEKTSIGKMVGEALYDSEGNMTLSPEKVTDKLANMEPTEIKNTLKFLDRTHPEAANMSRRYILENALQKASEGKGLRGEGTTKEFAKAEFVKSLPDKDTLNAILGDNRAYDNILDVAAGMNRMIDYGAAKKGSQTAQRTDFLQNIASWGKGALYRSIITDSLATDLLNPAKRQQLAVEARIGKAKTAATVKAPVKTPPKPPAKNSRLKGTIRLTPEEWEARQGKKTK